MKNEYLEEDKIKAAYALNMCSVSISQIIDYNDVYVLEQEYDAILNNLNLKAIPKDEALLRVLTEILNTITFFRIQSIKKEQIEKQYQYRMKNAIWSAIPSVSMFVSGNPITMALSLATTVGTGYMNYRKEKISATTEKEKVDMELQITAIEQLNALRRELFTTSWRLADEYDFDDELRLTEKQIKQYNDILIDKDEVRKYARLEAIQSKFKAYPPFWYFFGHTASYVSQTSIDEETKHYYYNKAKQHFLRYEELNKFNILREDQMTASFALEYIDLLSMEKVPDDEKIRQLIKIAIDKAGNNNDILQLCAMSCIKVGLRDEAARLLKILVNEDYNKVINAQMLSAIYVSQRNRPEYEFLTSQISSRYLFPMPASDSYSFDEINREFEKQQKKVLKDKFKQALQEIINISSMRLNRGLSIFDNQEKYPEAFFENSKKAKRDRVACAKNIFNDKSKSTLYLERLQFINLPVLYTEILQEMLKGIFNASCYNDAILQNDVSQLIKNAIDNNRDTINRIQQSIDMKSFGLREYEQIQKIGIIGLVKGAFEELYQFISDQIDNTDLNDLMRFESCLMNLCVKTGIEEPEIAIEQDVVSKIDFENEVELPDVSFFGTKAINAKISSDYIKEMLKYIKDRMLKIDVKGRELTVIYRDQIEFEQYFNNSIFDEFPQLKPHSIMVLSDNTKAKFDLIFTTEGIVYVLKNKVRTKTPYEDVKFTKDALDFFGKKYRSEYVDVSSLFQLIKELNKKFINNLDLKIEYFDGTVTAKTLDKWFTNNEYAMMDNVTKVYAWPEQSLLKQMGFTIEKEYDKDHFILQFFYNNEDGSIFDMRIVEFELLDQSLRDYLNKQNGIIKIER